jgi:hypothetical protein
MLAGFFGKKCDHPMADVKSAQLLLDDLPRHDPIKSVTELTEWIDSVAAHEGFKLADQYAVLSLLDETAKVYSRKLTYEYFSLHDMSVFHGKRLYMVLDILARQTANAYYLLFMRYCQADKGASVMKPLLPQLVARAIHASRNQLKYAAARYAAYDDALWLRLAQFYRHALQEQYLETPLALYTSVSRPVSVKSELGQLMTWTACALDSLTPQGIHLTERLVSQYARIIEIAADLSEQALFGFDAEYELTIVRLDADVTRPAAVRYLYLPELQAKLESLIKTLDKHIMPQELNLGGVFPEDKVREAAQHILKQLCAKPVRKSKRRPFNAPVHAVSGYNSVLLRCQGECDEHSDMQLTLKNASSGGFLAVFPAHGAAQVGHLLGIQTAGQPRLAVSITRRILRDEKGSLHLGAEMLSTNVTEVVVRANDNGDGMQHALWLHATDTGGLVRLLMPQAAFSLQCSLKTTLEGKNYLLIPVELQESGVDYDLASFRLIEQEDELE